MRRVMVAVALAFLVGDPSAGSLRAQEDMSVQADRGPRFLLASGANSTPTLANPARVALLRMRVTADLRDTTVEGALGVISAQTGIRFVYSADVVPLRNRTSLRANGISVAAALMEVLLDADVDVVLSGNQAALVRRIRIATAQVGAIAGRVTDATTQQGIEGVRVFLEGTRSSTSTGSTGSYRLTGVTAGAYTLATRRLGYKEFERAVTVEDGREVTVDVALQPVPSALDEVVVTVTGEQRLRELGHVVGRINADSLVREAPVSTLSELLTARVPGLQVFQAQGTVGGQVTMRLRGPNSLFLGAEPIVIVDGVRYSTAMEDLRFVGPSSVEARSPLNDLNPNDIESVEVVKGPSAATLYGTDAANGVIVIRTKRGRPGPAAWNAYGRMAKSEVPQQRYPDLYWGWSSNMFGDLTGFYSELYSCALIRQAQGWCTQDSVTVLPNPLNDPAFSLFASKPQWEYGASVSGGQGDFRYRFAGGFEDNTGPIQMPPAIAEQLRVQRGLKELPEEWRNPNSDTRINLRGNVTADLGGTAELGVHVGYVHSETRGLAASQRNPYQQGVFQGTPTTPPYGGGRFGPAQVFVQTSTSATDRFLTSANAQWRPAAWLMTRATLGLDLASDNRFSLARRGDAPDDECSTGCVQDSRVRQIATSGDVGATATARRGRVSARTSVGAQYARTLYNALSGLGFDLPPGAATIARAANFYNTQNYSETVTLGSYFEETLGLNDRLFLIGALRVDGASAFGRDYDAAAYPKVSASWLISEESFLPRVPGLAELRLRYAFGASGQQPTPAMALPHFSPGRAVLNGTIVPTIRTFLASPDLRPERVREQEFGFDATLFGSRLPVSLTWFRRHTVDQIIFVERPPGWGGMATNVGLTTGRGFEATITAPVLDTRLVSWDLTLQHGVHRTNLVDLGSSSAALRPEGGWKEGYPLGARFQQPILGYSDANGDGIIEHSEVQVGDTAVYMGESTPPRSQTITTVLGLFERRLRLSALLERRSGFTQIDGIACPNVTCRGAVDRTASFEDQVAALQVAGREPQPGDFTRLREVSAALELPAAAMRPLRLRSATLSVSARNLALWTKFKGADPESAEVGRAYGFAGDVANGIPQSRSYVLRLNLGL